MWLTKLGVWPFRRRLRSRAPPTPVGEAPTPIAVAADEGRRRGDPVEASRSIIADQQRRRDVRPVEIVARGRHVDHSYRSIRSLHEHDHREVEQMFAELESVRGKVSAEEAEHARKEHADTFPHMRQAIDPEELRKLGHRVEAFKKVAPTRPHPNVPNQALPRMAARSGRVVA